MSHSLLLEDDHVLSVEEALAFLDTWAPVIDGSTTSDTSTDSESLHAVWSSSPSTSPSAASSPPPLFDFEYEPVVKRKMQALTPKHAAAKPQRRPRTQKVRQLQSRTTTIRKSSMTKTREANTKAVNRYRQRNREEIQNLRQQVEQLSLHFTKLQERAAPVLSAQIALLEADTQALNSSSNLQLAVAEYQKLQESEMLNRKLKEAVTQQKTMNKTLEKVFQRQISTNNLDFIGKIRPVEGEMKSQDDAVVFREMIHYLKDVVYSTTATITAAIRKFDTTCLFGDSRVLQDPILGQVFEFTSNAPIPCTLQQLDARFWATLSGFVGNQRMGRATRQSRDTLENSCGRQFSMKFDTSAGEMQIDGVSAIRKFWTQDQIVYVFTALLAPVGTGLLFREQAWLILSKPSATAIPEEASSSVFQTCYRLFLEKRDTSSAVTPHTTFIYNAIMTIQSDRMRSQHLEIQEMLLLSQELESSECLQIECGDCVPLPTPQVV